MTVIKFGKWDVHSTDKFRYDRIRLRGRIWTPLCKKEKRISWEVLCSKPMTVKTLPLEEARPHGHWQQISPAGIYECSQCEQTLMTADIECYKYCHHCGAKMDEVSEDE